MTDAETSYAAGHAEGLREGRIMALEDTQKIHGKRIEVLDSRVSSLERVGYILFGAIALMQFAPTIKGFLG